MDDVSSGGGAFGFFLCGRVGRMLPPVRRSRAPRHIILDFSHGTPPSYHNSGTSGAVSPELGTVRNQESGGSASADGIIGAWKLKEPVAAMTIVFEV